MDNAVTAGLEPQGFFHWFERISRIPHGSGKEQQLAAFLQDYAQQRGYFCTPDAAGNLFMTVPATAGYEAEAPILFQAHMDMVWAKAPDVEFDFETQPLRLKVDGDRLHAQGTTLGADNAVGMATMLALADTGDIPHPPLEFLFTSREETGMHGIRAFDMTKIRARRMVNMDCGDSHVLGVSGAGRVSARIEKACPTEPLPKGWSCLQLRLGGGLGGHSGLEIHRERCCAGNAMGELLCSLADLPVQLCAMEGRGAILQSCSAVVALPAEALADAVTKLRAQFALIADVHKCSDPHIHLDIAPCSPPSAAVTARQTLEIAQVLRLLRSARYRCAHNDTAITVTSGSWSVLQLENGSLRLDYGFRSSLDADMTLLVQRHTALAKAFGLELKVLDGYPGWLERELSPFRDKFQRLHTALFGAEMELERVPGGIEVGIVTAAIPDMDPVGIAPTSRGAHSPTEYLCISEAEPYWRLLTAVLAEKEVI